MTGKARTIGVLHNQLIRLTSVEQAAIEALSTEQRRRINIYDVLRRDATARLIVIAQDLNGDIGDDPESFWSEGQKEYLRGQVEMIAAVGEMLGDGEARRIIESIIVGDVEVQA